MTDRTWIVTVTLTIPRHAPNAFDAALAALAVLKESPHGGGWPVRMDVRRKDEDDDDA